MLCELSFTLLFVVFICGWPTPACIYYFCIFIFRPIKPLTATITEGLVLSLHSGFTAWTYGVGITVPMYMNFGDGHRNPVCRGQEEIENNFAQHSVLACIFTQQTSLINISCAVYLGLLIGESYLSCTRIY